MKKLVIMLVFLLFYVSLVSSIDIEECGVLDEEGETYMLQNDIETDETCFRITADDITLDCNGYSITGPGNVMGIYGILIGDDTYRERISIIGCEISGFRKGIYLYAGESEIINNNLHENGRGIDLYGESNIIRGNTINENGGGIHFGWSSDSNIIRGNTINENRGDGIDFDIEFSYLNIIVGNTISGNGRNGIEIYGSLNTIIDNILNENGRGIDLYGDSNRINSNTFCYNNEVDIVIDEEGEDNEFLYNQCDDRPEDIECMPCDIEEHEIELNLGWNLISSYLVPYFTDIEAIFGPMARRGELLIVKDEDGRFYRPANNFNNIPRWVSTEAYYVKVNEDTELIIKGEEYTSLEIPVEQGWNYIAYPLTEALDMNDIIENILSPLIEDNILEMVKNDKGNFFVPRLNFNNIREMRPSEGYLVKVTEDAVIDFGE